MRQCKKLVPSIDHEGGFGSDSYGCDQDRASSESSLVIGDSIRFRRGEETWERVHVRIVHDAELNVSVDKEHEVDGKLFIAVHARRCVDGFTDPQSGSSYLPLSREREWRTT